MGRLVNRIVVSHPTHQHAYETVLAAESAEAANPIKTRWQKQVERSERGSAPAPAAEEPEAATSGFLDDPDAGHGAASGDHD